MIGFVYVPSTVNGTSIVVKEHLMMDIDIIGVDYTTVGRWIKKGKAEKISG